MTTAENPEESGLAGWRPITASQAAARDQVLGVARHRAAGRFQLVSESGCGKTVLLRELTDSLRGLGYATLFITCPVGDDTSANDLDRLLGTLATAETLIAELASDVARTEHLEPNGPRLAVDLAERLANRMRAARAAGPAPERGGEADPGTRLSSQGNEFTGEVGSLAQIAGDVHGGVHFHADESARLRVRLLAMRAGLVAALDELAHECPVAILVDELSRLDDGAAAWVSDVFDQLPGALIVGASLVGSGVTMRPPTRRLTLNAMTEAETVDYVLAELADWERGRADAVAALIIEIAGDLRHPVWVATWCQMISERLLPNAPLSAVDDLLRGGAAGSDVTEWVRRAGAFIDQAAADIVGRPVPLFDQLTVLHRVTEPGSDQDTSILGELLELDEDQADSLVSWLAKSSFTTQPGDDPESGFWLHDRLRHTAVDQLLATDPAHYRELHRAAERYYRDLLNFDQEVDEESPWAAWSRYEDPMWRRNSRDWLYHVGQLGRRAFQNIVPVLIRLFFEVFWWWEADTPTDYCKELLADYRRLVQTYDLQRRGGDEWLRRIEEFRANYVTSWADRVPGRHTENWTKVHTALWALWRMHHLSIGRIPEDWQLRRLYILICCYLGDAAWYTSTADPESRQVADNWYAAAEVACVEDAEQWIASWASYFRGDLWADIDPAKARQILAPLTDRVDDEDTEDGELRGLLTRVYADLAWDDGEFGLALDCYARACLHAYVYQVRQEIDRQAPTHYTSGFYRQMLDRFRLRVDEARADGGGDIADAAIARVRRLFAPYRKRWPTDAMTDNGFPPEAEIADLYEPGTPYFDRVESMLESMADQLDFRPLDGPLDLGEPDQDSGAA
ncbi:MAG TPA: ATP-binding protein [Pseudonocardiaceae bacterium]|nr:ATP-binding protein [Pseudonocardiaceae bacterium]